MQMLKQNPNQAEEALLLAKNDIIAFGKLFLPDDYLRSETPAFHYEVADTIDDRSVRQAAIILPRGHGKTILTKASILKDFLFCPSNDMMFYAWVSATQKLAVGNMDYIKYHLEHNEQITYYFGNQKGRKWTEEDIELSNGCKLISKSNVTGIRGGAKLHKRYDLIILDDFEHEENTLTRDSRDKNANLVTAVVYPALEPETGRIRVNGTPVHYDSFINNLLLNSAKAAKGGKDFAWTVITHKAIDDSGNFLWSSFFTPKIMAQKKQFYYDSGQPSKFYQEYFMQVQSEEDAIWRHQDVRPYDGYIKYDEDVGINYIHLKDENPVPVNCFIGCDPATDIDTKTSDFSVIMVIAVDGNRNVYVLEYERHRSIPTLGSKYDGGYKKAGVVDYILELYQKYHCTSATVEDVAMNRSVFQSLNEERKRLNKFSIAVIASKPGGHQKRNRIYSGLNGRFSMGLIHIRDNMFDLSNEIVTFGAKMAHDDTIEALYYACLNSFPPDYKEDTKEGKWFKQKRKAKSWLVA